MPTKRVTRRVCKSSIARDQTRDRRRTSAGHQLTELLAMDIVREALRKGIERNSRPPGRADLRRRISPSRYWQRQWISSTRWSPSIHMGVRGRISDGSRNRKMLVLLAVKHIELLLFVLSSRPFCMAVVRRTFLYVRWDYTVWQKKRVRYTCFCR